MAVRVQGQVRATHGPLFTHEPPQCVEIHVGPDPCEIGDGPGDKGLKYRPSAFLDLDAHRVARPQIEHLGQLFGQQEPGQGQGHGYALGIEEPVQAGVGGQTGQADPPLAQAVHDAALGDAERFGVQHPRQIGQGVQGRCGAGFDEADGHVLALGQPPLEIHEIVDAIAHGAGHDGNGRGHGQTQGGEKRLPGFAFQIAQGHALHGRQEAQQPQSFQQGRPEPGRRFGPHGLGRRQLYRLAHCPEDAQKGRGGAGGQGQKEGEPVRPENEVRELEEAAVDFDHVLA